MMKHMSKIQGIVFFEKVFVLFSKEQKYNLVQSEIAELDENRRIYDRQSTIETYMENDIRNIN